MGSSSSKTLDSAKSQPYREFTEHPLLGAIDNPINRFCDDFASSLTDDPFSRNPKMEIPMNAPEIQEIAGYTILGVIGNGAEAVVYQAVEKRSAIQLAIKQYRQVQYMENGQPREVSIARKLDHPNCIVVRDCFQDQNGDYVLVMPLSRKGEVKAWLRMVHVDADLFRKLVKRGKIRPVRRGEARNSPLYYSKKEIKQAVAAVNAMKAMGRGEEQDNNLNPQT